MKALALAFLLLAPSFSFALGYEHYKKLDREAQGGNTGSLLTLTAYLNGVSDTLNTLYTLKSPSGQFKFCKPENVVINTDMVKSAISAAEDVPGVQQYLIENPDAPVAALANNGFRMIFPCTAP
jgi:hypothetical protein